MTNKYPPRMLRPSEAQYYCGMGRSMFEREIRPFLTEIRLGNQGIGFDLLDLDQLLDDYKTRNVRVKEDLSCQKTKFLDSTGIKKQEKVRLTNESKGLEEFDIALQLARGKKRKSNIKKQ